MNTAIIVAAGTGSRFNSDTPKQFHELNGKPVICHTLARFDASSAVDSIVVVLAADDIAGFSELNSRHWINTPLAVVAGGRTRAHSVANGLAAADPNSNVIAVHDGARPMVTVDDIDRTITRADETGAACLVVGVTDTIKEVDGDEIVGTLDRRALRRAVTPQAFRYEILKLAFADESVYEAATDECYLVEQLGISIAAVPGNSRNIKITYQDDLLIAGLFLSQEQE